MVRTLSISAAIAGLVGLTFALQPAPLDRPLVEVPDRDWSSSSGVLVVDLVDGASEADLEAIEALIGADLDWTHPLSVDEALAEGQVTNVAAAIAALEQHSLVEAVEPEIDQRALGYPNDPLYEKQWHLDAMGAPAGWAQTPRGKGVVVAVIDTGVTQVEDLKQTQLLKGASFVAGTDSAADDQGHGTHVAGTIAQSTNNGIGAAGVAPEATILPVKVLNKWGMGSSADIAAGIDYAVDEGADVINLSLGGGYSKVIHTAIQKAKRKGVLVIAAAGNSGRRGVGYPGALAETLGVSALGPGGQLAPYSSYGKGVDIAAPGGDKRKAGGGVLQATVDGKGGSHYVEYQGTSMATPHVAGAAAVLLSTGLPASEVEEVLLRTADGTGWNEKTGKGHLNLAAALGASDAGSNRIRFFLGFVVAWLVAQLAGARGPFQLASAVAGGVAAGGFIVLDLLPLSGWVAQLLSQGVLQWPATLIGPSWMHFPLWLSVLPAAAVALTLGAYRPVRPLALGFCAGVAAHLFYGAATGELSPWWMPLGLDRLWLAGNATLVVLLAMGLAGTEKLEQETT